MPSHILAHKLALPQLIKSAQAQRLAPLGKLPQSDQPSHQNSTSQTALSQTTVQRALANPRGLAPHDILQLQRTAGNQAVQRMLQPESQAGFEADEDFEHQLSGSKGSGSPLPDKTKNEFEHSLGADLSHVRIHTNGTSNQLNRSIQAKAFTHGNDIHFDRGEYNPSTAQGKHLLAHELTHTIQQTGGKPSQSVQTKLQVGAANDRYEREADRIATAATSHKGGALPTPQAAPQPGPQPMTSPRVQRKLHFKPQDLKGKVSNKAKLKGMVGHENTFMKLQRLLTRYWKISRNDLQQQLVVLHALQTLSATWLQKNSKAFTNPKTQPQYLSVGMLHTEAARESKRVQEKLDSRAFFTKFEQKEYAENLKMPVTNDPLALGKQLYHNRKHNTSHPEDNEYAIKISDGKGGFGQKGKLLPEHEADRTDWINKYKAQKDLKLTEAHRSVLGAYTDAQYYLINPAMAGDEEWMKSQMVGNAKNRAHYEANMNKPGFVQKVMQQNREIGAMLKSALEKLPSWDQTQMLYRGETLTEDEAKGIKVGHIQDFQQFVSTSLSIGQSKTRIHENKKGGRWSIIYHIASSHSGKDIRAFGFGDQHMEQEILFAPGTRFQVTEVITFDPANKHIEVKVVQL